MKRTDTALVIRDGGGNARFAYDEFFKAAVDNPHTRRAYGRVVDGFLNWCSDNGLALQNVTPGIAGDYMQSRYRRLTPDSARILP